MKSGGVTLLVRAFIVRFVVPESHRATTTVCIVKRPDLTIESLSQHPATDGGWFDSADPGTDLGVGVGAVTGRERDDGTFRPRHQVLRVPLIHRCVRTGLTVGLPRTPGPPPQ
jgi:hypothetical protein